MPIVYIVTNKETNKSYIGMTTRAAEQRFKSHCSAARQGSPFRFHSAIRKYGIDAWNINVLAEHDDIHEIRKLEEHLIHEYRTDVSGYNGTSGGSGGWVVPDYKKESWRKKISRPGETNPRYSGLSNEELKSAVKRLSIEHGRVLTHAQAVELIPNFPKAFTKFRFGGRYLNLVEEIQKETGLVYYGLNKKSPETKHALRLANLGKKKIAQD